MLEKSHVKLRPLHRLWRLAAPTLQQHQQHQHQKKRPNMDWALLQPDRRAQVSFTPDQVIAAIKRAKASKAMGPDHISPIMLKHLGNIGILFLTNLYNNILLQSIVPPMWKVGRIIPLLNQANQKTRAPPSDQYLFSPRLQRSWRG